MAVSSWLFNYGLEGIITFSRGEMWAWFKVFACSRERSVTCSTYICILSPISKLLAKVSAWPLTFYPVIIILSPQVSPSQHTHIQPRLRSSTHKENIAARHNFRTTVVGASSDYIRQPLVSAGASPLSSSRSGGWILTLHTVTIEGQVTEDHGVAAEQELACAAEVGVTGEGVRVGAADCGGGGEGEDGCKKGEGESEMHYESEETVEPAANVSRKW